ncbi:MAG TPA: archaemetzincin family Zn-dependent metalloprotease [Terriglobia bacterium]|nr:archaemetzincin family Zn-dependent metalloprotease [Terriglobia bacterium]
MNEIHILPLAAVPAGMLGDLRAGLEQVFGGRVEILPVESPPAQAFNVSRQQYSSTEILAALARRAPPETRLLAVIPSDLYVPVLTFVFGEAQLEGVCAVVSTWRLRQDFYGLPADAALLGARLLKEAVHELGHTFGLLHCDDYQCVMASSHAVEWVDLKGSAFCADCRARLHTRPSLAPVR